MLSFSLVVSAPPPARPPVASLPPVLSLGDRRRCRRGARGQGAAPFTRPERRGAALPKEGFLLELERAADSAAAVGGLARRPWHPGERQSPCFFFFSFSFAALAGQLRARAQGRADKLVALGGLRSGLRRAGEF